MSHQEEEETAAVAPPQQQRSRRPRRFEWALIITFCFSLLSLSKLVPLVRNSVPNHNSEFDLPQTKNDYKSSKALSSKVTNTTNTNGRGVGSKEERRGELEAVVVPPITQTNTRTIADQEQEMNHHLNKPSTLGAVATKCTFCEGKEMSDGDLIVPNTGGNTCSSIKAMAAGEVDGSEICAIMQKEETVCCALVNQSIKGCSGGNDDRDYDFLRRELTTPCKKQGYSQGNQDCQLDNIFKNIGTTNKYYVEYGFNTKEQCSGSGPNTCKLWREHGWNGLLLDGDNENPEINLHSHYLYGKNAADILQQYDVPKELDFLSGDMDSHDYFVMDNILDHFSPRIVTTEYNMNWPEEFMLSLVDPTLVKGPKESFKFEGCIWGASASALKHLMESKGYILVGVTPSLDLFWGRRDLFEGCFDVPSFKEYEPLMGLGGQLHRKQRDLNFLHKLVDTKVWKETGDIDQARDAAQTALMKNMKSDAVLPCLSKVSEAGKLLTLEGTSSVSNNTTGTTHDVKNCDESVLDSLDKRFDLQRSSRQEVMKTSTKLSFDIYEPEATCLSEERFGSETRYSAFGDGPKFICGVDFIARQTANDGKKCLVYSVGSNNAIAFEKAVHKYMKGCDVHTFDPTLRGPFIGDEYATFHPWGLGKDGAEGKVRGKTWAGKSFETIIKELRHENRTIDVIKIDCEGCEYDVMPPLFELIASGRVKVNQVLIELHLREAVSQLKDFFWGADNAKMRVFHKERNGWGCGGKICVEYALASESFLREANRDTICPSHYEE